MKNNKQRTKTYGKTLIIITEHFSEQGKTLEELLTEVIIGKVRENAV